MKKILACALLSLTVLLSGCGNSREGGYSTQGANTIRMPRVAVAVTVPVGR